MAWAIAETVILTASLIASFLFGVKWGVESERNRRWRKGKGRS